MTSGIQMIHFSIIDDLHIFHDALDMEANIHVLLIHNCSSHSSLDVNGLELHLYETRVIMVVRSCTVNAKVTLSKHVN